MTTRDRLVLMGLVVLAVLGAGWLMVVKPERKKASEVQAQVSSARSSLSSAQDELSQARAAETRYTQAYASIVRMGKAVPPGQEVASLVYELDQASGHRNVSFESITSSEASSSSTSTPAVASAGFQQLPFTFSFSGSFDDLAQLLARLDNFTTSGSRGALFVNGRLLTIQSVDLSPANASASESQGAGKLNGTITATAYVLPVTQGLTGGATPASPAGSATQTVSGSSTPGSPTSAAVVEANP
jgi:Tfp pilus assembly protein PilO